MQPTMLYFVLTKHNTVDAGGTPFTYLETRYICTSRKAAEILKVRLGSRALLRTKIYTGFLNGNQR